MHVSGFGCWNYGFVGTRCGNSGIRTFRKHATSFREHHSGNSVRQCLAVHAVVCGIALYVYVHTILCVAHNIIFIGMPLLYKERGGTEPHIPRISILAD
jgi:hypothetical protein